MQKQAAKSMLALIRSVVCGYELTEDEQHGITAELLPPLYALSKAHDMAHVVAHALAHYGLLGTDEVSLKFQKQQMLAIYRYQRLAYELERLCDELERAQIPFLPLKGAVIRPLYPEPWLRTSCDIDVLVHEADLERAITLLTSTLQYQSKGRSSHDVSLFSEGGVHVELHYDLIEEVRYPAMARLLSAVWDYTELEEGCSYRYRMREEMFYFYHTAHMAKHFENGGCGVRSVLDQWILDHRAPHDRAKRDELAQTGGLDRFDFAARELAEMWFSGSQGSSLTEAMSSYVLTGGVYGSTQNGVAIKRAQKGGKFKYILSRLILPYDVIKVEYPILQKHRWLTPFMQIRRWFRALFGGRIKHSLQELDANQAVSQEQVDSVAALRRELGL